jgi:hypothetical protein
MTMTAAFDPTALMTTPSTATAAQLLLPRTEAMALLSAHLEKGMALRNARIRNPEDLDKARSIKLQWTQAATDLLNRLFDSSAVADFFNDFVGKIFPEYAEFGNFVEQFYEEMHHRTARLRSIVEGLNLAADAAPAPAAAPMRSAPAAPPTQHTAAAPTAVAPPSATFSGPGRAAPRAVKAVIATTGHPTPYADAVVKFLEQLGVVVVKVAATTSLVDAMSKESDAAFAAVLLDAGEAATGDATPRDERELLFELGYCAGRVGTQRVCVLHPAGRSPLAGAGAIEHLGIDTTGGWQLQLARLMKRCGIDVDLNRLC